jgi:golgi SNAP receptor complex member 1
MMRTGATTPTYHSSTPSAIVPIPSPPTLSDPTSTSWESLRKQARQLQNEIELKLTTLSKLGVRGSGATAPMTTTMGAGTMATEAETVELEIEDLLGKV